jgi:hypothetical protein
MNNQAFLFTNFFALIIHCTNRLIPLLHALFVARQVEASDCYFSTDYAMNRRPPISYHKDEFCLQKNYQIIAEVLEKSRHTFGKSSITYEPILSVSGSLLHKYFAADPCFAMISKTNCAIALFRTSLVIPASSSLIDSFSDFIQ